MRFRCPFCYYTITVDDMSRGYPVVCAGCNKEVMIPPGRFDPGCIIGDFVILEKLGAGSIGSVYKATQLSLDRQVALKILSPEYTTSKGIDDFLREARAAAKLTHTNLVQAYAVGEDDGFCYMAMTYVNGENLRTRLRREGRIPVDEALHIVQQVAEALYYAWDEVGLIHRDVKPDNIMITDDGIVKLTDLGLAMNQSEWSEDMEISGSPSYMSPEQFRGEKLDPRSDIYSLGVTLFQMISGRLPFESDSVKKLAQMHLEKDLPSLRHLVPGVPMAVDALVKRMVAKRPENRYPSMEEVLKAIWTIRQKTAPNKSLVPDVHTISIKRLDYEIQNESSELKAKVTEKITVQASWMDRLITGFVTAVAVVVLMVILFSVFGSRGEAKLRIFDKVTYFEKLSSDKSLDVGAILDEGRKILDELPNRGTAEQEFNLAKMRMLLLSVELNALRNETLQLKQENTGLKQKNNALTNEKKHLVQRNGQLERMVGEYSNYGELKRQLAEKASRIKQLELAVAAQRKETVRLKQVADAKQQSALARIQDEIRLKLLRLQLDRRFREADALIDAKKQAYPPLSAWLTKKADENLFLSRIYKLLTDSGTRFAGYPLGTEGMSILNINGGTISYKDSLGRTFLKEWQGFQPRTLYRLLQNDSVMKRNPKAAEAGCELLQERIGTACKKNPDDKELQAVAAVYADNKAEQLKYASVADPEKTQESIREFLRNMEGAKDYQKLERMLNPLLR